MKDVFKFIFFIFLIGCTLMGCTQPVGNISGNSGGGGGDAPDFWFIEVVKRDYYIGDDFKPTKAYYITAFQDGVEVRKYADDPGVETTVWLNVEADVYNSKLPEGEIPFTEAGEHEVQVTYSGKTKHYRIKVIGADAGPGGPGDGLGGGILWPDP